MREDQNRTDAAETAGRLDRRSFVRGGAVVVGAAAAGFAARTASRQDGDASTRDTTTTLSAPRVSAVPQDPEAAVWAGVPREGVRMLPQHMAAPRLAADDLAVETVDLQVLHDGDDLAFRLRWADEEVDDVEAMGRFRDSVAVQMPVHPELPTTVAMGQPGRPVHMLHWRASWQRELDEEPRTLGWAFPHAVPELTADELLGHEGTRMLSPAVQANNVVAKRERTSAVEELVGEGIGTLTAYREQLASGRAVHANGAWTVTLVTPMRGGTGRVDLRPGDWTLVALAAWNGGKGNRGARKQWSHWLTIDLEE